MCSSYVLGGKNSGIGQLGAQKGLECKRLMQELSRLSYVHALWACRCHSYIESTDSLILSLVHECLQVECKRILYMLS